MLKLSNISKSFDDKVVLDDVSFEAEAGEIIALLGPSGCGKTTLLRIIAGLETAEQGQLTLHGQDLMAVPVYQRGFGMVFQDYALFPHKTAAENVAFGLRMAGWTAFEQRQRVAHLLEMVGLAGMGERAVYDLSGGEQQRVALARALAPAPRLLLLDEPFGALDRTLRERLMDELQAILERAAAELAGQEQVITIYVTHDQEEAFAVAGRVMVMNKGRIEQSGPPLALYRSPATPFVARFLGMDNLLEGVVVEERPYLVETAIGRIEVGEDNSAPPGSKGTLLIRPEAAEIVVAGEVGERVLRATLEHVSFRGRYQIVQLIVANNNRVTPLKLSFSIEAPLPTPGSQLRLALLPEKCKFYLEEPGPPSTSTGSTSTGSAPA